MNLIFKYQIEYDILNNTTTYVYHELIEVTKYVLNKKEGHINTVNKSRKLYNLTKHK